MARKGRPRQAQAKRRTATTAEARKIQIVHETIERKIRRTVVLTGQMPKINARGEPEFATGDDSSALAICRLRGYLGHDCLILNCGRNCPHRPDIEPSHLEQIGYNFEMLYHFNFGSMSAKAFDINHVRGLDVVTDDTAIEFKEKYKRMESVLTKKQYNVLRYVACENNVPTAALAPLLKRGLEAIYKMR